MYRPGHGPSILCASLLLILSACGEQGSHGDGRSSAATATAAAGRPAATRLTQREVEAPHVFQKTEAGLWDGRPSLGGVWVAHPDVADPERVLIRNEATGETVVGALFRRERDNPGPRFQVSSDAAGALGLIAGAPTKLSVTALRREEASSAAEDAADASAEADRIADDDSANGDGEDAADASGGGFLGFLRGGDESSQEATREDTDAEEPEAAAEAVASDRATTGDAAEASANPAPRGFLFGLFSRARSDQGDEGADAAPVSAVATAVLPDADPDREPRATLERGLVQIGIFSIEGNADRTAEMMRENGLAPTVYEHASAGRSYWRVVVGPATTRAERDRLEARARSLGFTDAFPVSR